MPGVSTSLRFAQLLQEGWVVLQEAWSASFSKKTWLFGQKKHLFIDFWGGRPHSKKELWTTWNPCCRLKWSFISHGARSIDVPGSWWVEMSNLVAGCQQSIEPWDLICRYRFLKLGYRRNMQEREEATTQNRTVAWCKCPVAFVTVHWPCYRK